MGGWVKFQQIVSCEGHSSTTGIIGDMEQTIVDYLRETYKPEAIILHGSRASGHERAHSDWDFVLLYSSEIDLPKNGRTKILGENIEFSHHHLPIVDVMKEFSVKLQNARVVYESESFGAEVLQSAQTACLQPLAWTPEEKHSHSLWMQGRIAGMSDTLNEPLLFEKYAADFYTRITNYWYWAIHDRYSKPMYLALEEIKDEDSEYFLIIKNFVQSSNEEKVNAAERIYQKCFGLK
jgi:hypothetical protein